MHRLTRLQAAAAITAAALTLTGCASTDSTERDQASDSTAPTASDRPGDTVSPAVDASDDHADAHEGERHEGDENDGGDEHAHGDGAAGPDEAGEWPMQVYFVSGPEGDPRLVPQVLRVTVAEGQSKVAAGVLAAIDGDATDPDYRSAWVSLGAAVETVSVEQPADPQSSTPTTVTVTLAHDLDKKASKQLAAAALQQLAYTASSIAGGPAEVSVRVGKGKTATFAGVPATRVGMAPADDMLAPLSILNVDEGYQVASPVLVAGMANVPEATVVWQLKRGDKTVKRGFTTAAEAFRMAPFEFTIKASPGTYTLVVSGTDPSGGEGRKPWTETKTVTVVE